MVLLIILAIIVAVLGYVRFAAHDADRHHVKIQSDKDRDMVGGAVRVITADADGLARVDAAAREMPRTQVLSGSVAEGHITYVTRSKWIGFPDYTTVEQQGDHLKFYARLRFGKSDFGVNRDRLERLVAAAKP